MQALLFTKLFQGQSLDEIARAAHDLGVDGVDLLVREGHQVDPREPEALPAAISALAREGIAVPLVTTDLTDPAAYPAERLIGQCAAAGVRLVRLGHWAYDPRRGYAPCREAARHHLQALERLARHSGVRLAVQVHGGTIHCSGALTAALLKGHDPACIGAYADPGNQAVQDGWEDPHLMLDLLRPWLCCVGVKNGVQTPMQRAASGQRRWRGEWVGLADGLVPWDAIIAQLCAIGFDGPLSLHSFYDAPLAQVVDQTRRDLGFIRRQLPRASPRTAGID